MEWPTDGRFAIGAANWNASSSLDIAFHVNPSQSPNPAPLWYITATPNNFATTFFTEPNQVTIAFSEGQYIAKNSRSEYTSAKELVPCKVWFLGS